MSPTDASMESSMLVKRFDGTKNAIRLRIEGRKDHGVDVELCRLHSVALMDLLDGIGALLEEREQDRADRIARQTQMEAERRETFWKITGAAIGAASVVATVIGFFFSK